MPFSNASAILRGKGGRPLAKTPTRSQYGDRLTLRPREAAQSLGVCETTFRKLMRSGAIPHIRLDRAVLVPVADLEAFIAERLNRGGRV
jgi:excisionase family DNA binding protein